MNLFLFSDDQEKHSIDQIDIYNINNFIFHKSLLAEMTLVYFNTNKGLLFCEYSECPLIAEYFLKNGNIEAAKLLTSNIISSSNQEAYEYNHVLKGTINNFCAYLRNKIKEVKYARN